MRTLLTLAALVAVVSAASAEPIDNPAFKSWSKFKPGTQISMKTESEFNKMKSEIVIVSKLVEVGADKCVIEVETTTKINGMEFKAPAMKQDVPKTYDLPKPKDGKGPKVETPDVQKEEGKETLKIGGVEVKTTWMKYKSKSKAGESEGQTWMSDDVPGGLVKSVSKSGDVSTKTELIEIKKP
jgi:hypothetical protein